ncbi:sulfotransferase 6B1-like [Bombina bombina]|uniref:sulfotransferase 6B1-like n=1 Tax=Bombina bombina TaxID=8345 RepID=UPI00235AABCA|nr:sulfotransferase 6B1-like [Bombina bombina]
MAEDKTFKQEIQNIFEAGKHTPLDKLVFTYKGVLYPSVPCNIDIFQALESFEARNDDILLASYPKCGSNWTLQLLSDMIKVAYSRNALTKIPILEFAAPDKFEKLKQEGSPRLLSTHLLYDNIPKNVFEKRVKIVLVIRNPKDTAVSFFHFYNSNVLYPTYNSWDTFFQDFISGKVAWGSYFDQMVAWNKHIDDDTVYIVTYEEMKQDLKAAVKKMAGFLGISLNEEQVQQIADDGTFKSMKEKAKESYGDFVPVFFRKGEVGDWKNYFTEAQNQEIDAKFEEYLAGTKLGEMINYNVYCK